ncbi:MAG: YdbL family protein [Pseudomonadota bacterium]
MKISQKSILAGAATGIAVLFASASAASPLVENAKDQCIVGEQADGYLGIVDGAAADAALRREVRDINQQRKAAYTDIAARNGVSINVTAALTAEKLINDARPGECVRDASGAWIQL